MENDKKQSINTPTAIIVAGFIIMLGILITNGSGKGLGKDKTADNKDKTLSEQVGIKKADFDSCIAGTDKTTLQTKIAASVEKAMKALKPEERGTPYAVVIGKNGVKTEIRGALPIDQVKKAIAEVTAGKVTTPYKGEIVLNEEGDHLFGSADAPVVVVEYSDYECPYCKAFQATMKQVVEESNGQVAWMYRHWPIHAGSVEKLVAAECVAKLKGNDAFWKYSELLFGLLNPTPAPAASNL